MVFIQIFWKTFPNFKTHIDGQNRALYNDAGSKKEEYTMMSKRKKWATALLTVAGGAVLYARIHGRISAEKPMGELFTGVAGATVTQTADGLEVNVQTQWENSVEINSYFDIENFEFEFSDTLNSYVDIRFYDSVTPDLKYFIRVNGEGKVRIFVGASTLATDIIVSEMFVDGKCNVSVKNGRIFVNGTDSSSYTGGEAITTWLAKHFDVNFTNNLARVRFAYDQKGTSTLTRLNGTSLAEGATDTSKPFFRLASVPESSVAAGSNVAVSYTVYDLIDDAPTVSAEYRLTSDTEGEWTNTAVSDSTFSAPQAAGSTRFV